MSEQSDEARHTNLMSEEFLTEVDGLEASDQFGDFYINFWVQDVSETLVLDPNVTCDLTQ